MSTSTDPDEGFPSWDALRITAATAIAVSSAIYITRAAFGVAHKRWIFVEDGWLLTSFLFFLATAVMYFVTLPVYYRSQGTPLDGHEVSGEEDANDGGDMAGDEEDDFLFVRQGIFVTTLTLWFSVWCSKFALLWRFKGPFGQLFRGRGVRGWLWWAVVAACAVFLAAAVGVLLGSCGSPTDFFEEGACDSARDELMWEVTVYYSYAADVVTVLMGLYHPVPVLCCLIFTEFG